MEPKTKKPEQEAKKTHWLKWISEVIFVLLIMLLIGGTIWYFNNRTLPNIFVGGASAGQASRAKLSDMIHKQASAMTVTFMVDNKPTVVPAKDLGVTVDVEATVNHALNLRRTGGILQRLNIWKPQSTPLIIDNDPGVLKAYVQQHFASAFADPKDAHIVYNDQTQAFDIQPSTTGKGFDIKSFETALPQLAQHPRNFILNLSTLPVQPLIASEGLVPVRAEANKRLQLGLHFSLSGSDVYVAKPSEIANWMHFIPDATKGTASIEYDTAKIQQFLDQKVGPTIAAPPVDKKVIVDSQSGQQTILQAGSTGKQIDGTDKMAGEVQQALLANQPLNKEVTIVEAPFKTITVSTITNNNSNNGGEHWVEVDLSKQTATMYQGNAVIQSFLISSGTAAHPTIPGEYHVWLKVPSQTMTERANVTTGDYFYLPNVKWVSYFDGERAFHGTYWHHNFGHPMSHGCINMTEGAAKIMYDFTPVGTRVVVHY